LADPFLGCLVTTGQRPSPQSLTILPVTVFAQVVLPGAAKATEVVKASSNKSPKNVMEILKILVVLLSL
jgi:hypothetical protein